MGCCEICYEETAVYACVTFITALICVDGRLSESERFDECMGSIAAITPEATVMRQSIIYFTLDRLSANLLLI